MTHVQNLTPAEVSSALNAGDIVLIDVREPNEFADVRIAGSLNFPLSSFDPAALPDPEGKTVILMCAGGVRSVRALEACQLAGLDIDRHLDGGIRAWHAAGFPIEG